MKGERFPVQILWKFVLVHNCSPSPGGLVRDFVAVLRLQPLAAQADGLLSAGAARLIADADVQPDPGFGSTTVLMLVGQT